MKFMIGLAALCLLVSLPAAADQPGFQDALLDHFAGEWVMHGTIAGGEATHDVVAEWVLNHQYMRFSDVARELDDEGKPAYEAIVFIGWDEPTNRYACLWLDCTGGGGLTGQGIGHAKRSGNDIPFLFDTGDGNIIYNTFSYGRDTDTWTWAIDSEKDGDRTPFARVTLTRR